MKFKTTRDILDRIKMFHEQLSKFYSQQSNITEKERVKLLLDYMARHELRISENLTKFENGASKRIMNTWFKYAPINDIPLDCKSQELKPDMSVEEVISLALKFDDCLIKTYKQLAENCTSKKVKSLFTTLLKMEKREECDFVRNAQEVNDL